MKIASRCAPWKCAHCFAAAAVLEHGRRPQIPRRKRHVIIELVIVLWRVNLTLALYRSLLNRKSALKDVLKDSAWMFCVDFPCTPTKRYTDIFHSVYKGNIPSFPFKMRHSQSMSTTETGEIGSYVFPTFKWRSSFLRWCIWRATNKLSIRSGLKQTQAWLQLIACL
jgi:hypothetical protein